MITSIFIDFLIKSNYNSYYINIIRGVIQKDVKEVISWTYPMW